ncbi:hypothetical protein NDU88_007566 [Pleurodeles waltl]|uniref:Uncharacterized protein n=1 Tax=Pleurodeles waltl TaxID=8319 RepID=A0AAV7N2E2_PLEWA|nr:hypothetical protein NDU88_007566 [Pleurodeles waltl]
MARPRDGGAASLKQRHGRAGQTEVLVAYTKMVDLFSATKRENATVCSEAASACEEPLPPMLIPRTACIRQPPGGDLRRRLPWLLTAHAYSRHRVIKRISSVAQEQGVAEVESLIPLANMAKNKVPMPRRKAPWTSMPNREDPPLHSADRRGLSGQCHAIVVISQSQDMLDAKFVL